MTGCERPLGLITRHQDALPEGGRKLNWWLNIKYSLLSWHVRRIDGEMNDFLSLEEPKDRRNNAWFASPSLAKQPGSEERLVQTSIASARQREGKSGNIFLIINILNTETRKNTDEKSLHSRICLMGTYRSRAEAIKKADKKNAAEVGQAQRSSGRYLASSANTHMPHTTHTWTYMPGSGGITRKTSIDVRMEIKLCIFCEKTPAPLKVIAIKDNNSPSQ